MFVEKILSFSFFSAVLHCKTGLILHFKCFAVSSLTMSHLDVFRVLGRMTLKGFRTFWISHFTIFTECLSVFVYSLSGGYSSLATFENLG